MIIKTILLVIWGITFAAGCYCMNKTRVKRGSEESRKWNLAAIAFFGMSLITAMVEHLS